MIDLQGLSVEVEALDAECERIKRCAKGPTLTAETIDQTAENLRARCDDLQQDIATALTQCMRGHFDESGSVARLVVLRSEPEATQLVGLRKKVGTIYSGLSIMTVLSAYKVLEEYGYLEEEPVVRSGLA